MGRTLVLSGVLPVMVGLGVILLGRTGIPFGRLPGDINLRGRSGSFHLPLVTCLLLSAAASLLPRLVGRVPSLAGVYMSLR